MAAGGRRLRIGLRYAANTVEEEVVWSRRLTRAHPWPGELDRQELAACRPPTLRGHFVPHEWHCVHRP